MLPGKDERSPGPEPSVVPGHRPSEDQTPITSHVVCGDIRQEDGDYLEYWCQRAKVIVTALEKLDWNLEDIHYPII